MEHRFALYERKRNIENMRCRIRWQSYGNLLKLGTSSELVYQSRAQGVKLFHSLTDGESTYSYRLTKGGNTGNVLRAGAKSALLASAEYFGGQSALLYYPVVYDKSADALRTLDLVRGDRQHIRTEHREAEG